LQEGVSTHIKSFIGGNGKVYKKEIKSTSELNVVLRNVIGDHMHELYFDSLDEEADYRIKYGLMGENEQKKIQKSDHIENIRSLSDEAKQEMAHDYIMRDLFIWSILMNYTDMAIVFLSHMKYRICPALIATKVYKQYHHAETYGESREDYDKKKKYFEKYAIDCISKCDANDADQACEIILQQNNLYGYVSCLQV
jgi:hypothetical protein